MLILFLIKIKLKISITIICFCVAYLCCKLLGLINEALLLKGLNVLQPSLSRIFSFFDFNFDNLESKELELSLQRHLIAATFFFHVMPQMEGILCYFALFWFIFNMCAVNILLTKAPEVPCQVFVFMQLPKLAFLTIQSLLANYDLGRQFSYRSICIFVFYLLNFSFVFEVASMMEQQAIQQIEETMGLHKFMDRSIETNGGAQERCTIPSPTENTNPTGPQPPKDFSLGKCVKQCRQAYDDWVSSKDSVSRVMVTSGRDKSAVIEATVRVITATISTIQCASNFPHVPQNQDHYPELSSPGYDQQDKELHGYFDYHHKVNPWEKLSIKKD